MENKKINIFLSTFNFVLCFVGYQLVTTLLLPASSDTTGLASISRTVTVPYRAFTLIISIIVIFLNLRNLSKKIPFPLKLFLFFWLALIVRVFYDTAIRFDVKLEDTSHLWLYIFGICLPAVFSILISYDNIDLDKSLKWIYIGILITLFLTFFSKQYVFVSAEMKREDANIAFDTIGYVHLGTTGVILSLFILSRKKLLLFKKLGIFLFIGISLFSMLRAGSRGPIVALIFVMLFWLFVRGKNILIGTTIVIVSGTLLFISMNSLLNSIGKISPIMEARLKLTIYEGHTSGRDPLYQEAIQAFLDKPILGKQFALFNNQGGFIYSHNIILDTFMGLGIIGGFVIIWLIFMALKMSFNLIKTNDSNYWIALILIQEIVANMFSGAIYYDYLLSALLAFIFVYAADRQKTRIKKGQNRSLIPVL